MNILKKQFIVVYDEESRVIITQPVDNTETTVGKGRSFAEFDTEDELNEFVLDGDMNNL